MERATTTAPRVPEAWPKGMDFDRFLILLAAAAVGLSVLVVIGQEEVAAPSALEWALLSLAGAGAALIAARPQPRSFVPAAAVVCVHPLARLLSPQFVLLFEPLQGAVFASAWFSLCALALALPAGFLGRSRAGRAEHVSIHRGWRSRQGGFAIATVSVTLSVCFTGALATVAAQPRAFGGADFTADEVGAQQATIEILGFDFRPSDLNVTAGRIVELRLINHDDTYHTFTYHKDGREYNHDLFAGANTTAWLYFPQPGTVRYRCVPHSADYDDGMVGRLAVVA